MLGFATGCDKQPASEQSADQMRHVDLEAHRGGRGLTVEESLAGFAKAIELGVTTLELDTMLSADKVPLIWHDPEILADKCSDTTPAVPDDPAYPYVGKLVHDLSYAQIQTLDCGKTLESFPGQQPLPGNRIATLPQLFDQMKAYPGQTVRYNIDVKVQAARPEESATPEESVDAILDAIHKAGETDYVEIQSYDWRVLPLVRTRVPSIPLVAQYDETTFAPASPWLGPVRYEDHVGDPLGAAKALGANIVSPGYSVPYGGKVGDKGFKFIATKAYVDQAHYLGLKVIPGTINDQDTIADQLETGVDGIVTDYPDRARDAMQKQDLPLPPAFRRH